MVYVILLAIIFFLVISILVINYDKPSKKINLTRYSGLETLSQIPKSTTKIKETCQKFTEINDLKLIPSNFKQNWTIMFWIKVNAPHRVIYIQKGPLPMMILDPPYFKFLFNTPSGKFETIDNIEKNSTKHITWVQENMSIKIFENAKPYLISDPNQNFTQLLPKGDLKINTELGNLTIRNLRIYNTAQTYDQVLKIYNTEKPFITGETYIEKKASKEEIAQAKRHGEIYSPLTKLKEIHILK